MRLEAERPEPSSGIKSFASSTARERSNAEMLGSEPVASSQSTSSIRKTPSGICSASPDMYETPWKMRSSAPSGARGLLAYSGTNEGLPMVSEHCRRVLAVRSIETEPSVTGSVTTNAPLNHTSTVVDSLTAPARSARAI